MTWRDMATKLARNGDNDMIPLKRSIIRDGVQRWEVDFGYVEGKRERHLCKNEEEADDELNAHRKKVKGVGDYLARLTDAERGMIVAVHQEVTKTGKTLSGVWGSYQERQKEVSAQSTTTPQAYEDVVTEWRRRKLAAGKSSRYVRNTGDFLEKFGEGRLRMNIHEIPSDDLEKWIDAQAEEKEWGLSTRRTYITLFSSLWSVAKDKGWVTLNICDRLEPVGRIPVKVEIYPNEITRNLMAAALEIAPTILAPLSLGFFGCMRPEEIDSTKAKDEGMPESEYFQWLDIDLKNGLCKVRITKTGDERTIRMQPTHVLWMKEAKAKHSPLPPINERKLVDACCELIGLTHWIRDGARKNCATHLREVYKNDYDVIKDCGNSIRVLLKHYAALHVPPEVSMEHWEITPDAVRKFMKTKAWEKIKRDAAKLNFAAASKEQ